MLSALLLLAQAPTQLMIGPSFDQLLRRTERVCPGSPIRYATPAALLDAEDLFVDHLPSARARAVRRAIPRMADGTPRRCSDRNGAACPATAELDAFARAEEMGRFAKAACAAAPTTWR